jgi:hypothetical protein
MLIDGKCHCANIAFKLEWEGDPPEIPARACNCSFCVKHGGVWTSNPKARLAVAIRDASLVSKYVFASRTRPHFMSARAAAPCRWLPAKLRTISMRSSTSTFWKMSTHRGFTEPPSRSRAKMSDRVLRVERATGSPMSVSSTKGTADSAEPRPPHAA